MIVLTYSQFALSPISLLHWSARLGTSSWFVSRASLSSRKSPRVRVMQYGAGRFWPRHWRGFGRCSYEMNLRVRGGGATAAGDELGNTDLGILRSVLQGSSWLRSNTNAGSLPLIYEICGGIVSKALSNFYSYYYRFPFSTSLSNSPPPLCGWPSLVESFSTGISILPRSRGSSKSVLESL